MPVKRQTMIALAKPSIAESRPKPISATEPARMPARIAIEPSSVMYARLAHESSFTRVARRPVGLAVDAAPRRSARRQRARGVLIARARRRLDGRQERTAGAGDGVHDHLAVAAAGDEPAVRSARRWWETRFSGALADPRDVADAQLVGLRERRGDRQARRVAERLGALGERRAPLVGQARRAQRLGLGQVEAQQVAAVVGHDATIATSQRTLRRKGCVGQTRQPPAISSSVRPLTTDSGRSATMSEPGRASSSRRLISSHCGLAPGRVR